MDVGEYIQSSPPSPVILFIASYKDLEVDFLRFNFLNECIVTKRERWT